VATAMTPAIAEAELRRAIRKPPDSVDAWVAYQRGLWHLRKATADDNPLAGKFFQQAIDLDPTFSAAYGGLAIARTAAADFQGLPLSEIENAVEALARRAVALDPGNSEAVSFLASIMYGGVILTAPSPRRKPPSRSVQTSPRRMEYSVQFWSFRDARRKDLPLSKDITNSIRAARAGSFV